MNTQIISETIRNHFRTNSIAADVRVIELDEVSWKLEFTWTVPGGRAAYALNFWHEEMPQEYLDMLVSRTSNNITASMDKAIKTSDVITYVENDGTISDHYPSDPENVRKQGEGEWISSAQVERTYELVSGVVRNYAARHPELVGDVFQKVDGRTWMVKREWAGEKWGKSWEKRYALVEEIHDKGYMTDAKWRRQQGK